MKKIVLGTQNADKLREVKQILEPLGFTIVTLSDVGLADMDVVEDGQNFAENAVIKATAYGRACQLPVLADDSGLAVDALDGAPGIYSARYGGEHANYLKNNQKLIAELDGVPTNARKAQFVCALAYVDVQNDIVHIERGEVAGIILERPLGDGGFGYDPLFYLPDIGLTFAQAEPAVKNRFSHRARALAKMKQYLQANHK